MRCQVKRKKIRQESQEKQSQARISRKKNQARQSREKRIRQELKNTRIWPGGTFLASSDKLLSTRIPQESQDQFFQARILYRRNGKRILTDNQEKQESGKKDGKNVDQCNVKKSSVFEFAQIFSFFLYFIFVYQLTYCTNH